MALMLQKLNRELVLGDRRRRDLVRIRQTYIPELIIRLHSILVGSRSRIPEYVVLLLVFVLVRLCTVRD